MNSENSVLSLTGQAKALTLDAGEGTAQEERAVLQNQLKRSSTEDSKLKCSDDANIERVVQQQNEEESFKNMDVSNMKSSCLQIHNRSFCSKSWTICLIAARVGCTSRKYFNFCC
ncbi:unnamed protein product [Gongylonema pulchrum]|uniref:Uncharacterized protein n=1 Tax=Gongylonema pulchrum TaxID=637853 RepID=A0A183D9P5_9BILA|nr:unnamed protein product [Gongylonema pulchrum]